MVVTCFNPSAPTCDDGSGKGAFFSNIRIPKGDGTFDDGRGCPVSTRFGSGAAGADIADLEVVPDDDPAVGERVVFDSTWGSFSNPDGFPAYGSLTKQDGLWKVDLDSRRWPIELHQSSDAGRDACPTNTRGATGCGAFSEMARLPRSGRLVVGQYALPGIIVLASDGTVLATHQWGDVLDACHPGKSIVLSAREIDADPTSAVNDERFVVIFDNSDSRGQPVQEFSYNEADKTLTATSAAVSPQTAIHPAAQCGETGQVRIAQYDEDGNLWIGNSESDRGGPLSVFLKDPDTGIRTGLEVECSATDPATRQSRPWAFPCTADLDTGLLYVHRGRTDWAYPFAANMLEDRATRTVIIVSYYGDIGVLERSPSSGGPTFTARSVVDLGLERLQPLQADELTRGSSKGIIDEPRRALWIPITTAEVVEPENCTFWTCNQATGKQRNAHLYRVDVDQMLANGPRIISVRQSTAARAGKAFSVRLTATTGGPLDPATSGLVVYEKESAKPIANIAWHQSCGRSGTCTYRARVPGAATRGKTGKAITWHALMLPEHGDGTLHAVGVVRVVL